jgi:hypothetical protein
MLVDLVRIQVRFDGAAARFASGGFAQEDEAACGGQKKAGTRIGPG